MPVINFRDSEILARDVANQGVQSRVASRTVKFGLFNTPTNVAWAADRMLKSQAFPLATISFAANRTAFLLDPGDSFRLTYAPYGIADKIFRVTSVREDGPDSERITVDAVEDVNYLSNFIGDDTGSGGGFEAPAAAGASQDDFTSIEALEYVEIVEAPYVLAGAEVKIVALAARETGNEIGFRAYMSLDGSTYALIGVGASFTTRGALVGEYSENTFQIDDEAGIEVDFSNTDVSHIETVTRAEMIAGANMAMIGFEIISFQTITPVSGNRYAISGVYRGRFDTEKQDHTAGESCWFLGQKLSLFEHTELLPGTTRNFKIVPYNAKFGGDIVDATAVSLALSGRAKTPYCPLNFMANNAGVHATYTGDIALTWSPRVRGEGAGLGDPDTIVDAEPTWEGLFEVEVWAGGSLVRTATAIDDDEWTYTEAMNLADNTCLPTIVAFKLRNYQTEGGLTYKSGPVEITVTNAAGCDLGPATTTTTTTSTTSTTTT